MYAQCTPVTATATSGADTNADRPRAGTVLRSSAHHRYEQQRKTARRKTYKNHNTTDQFSSSQTRAAKPKKDKPQMEKTYFIDISKSDTQLQQSPLQAQPSPALASTPSHTITQSEMYQEIAYTMPIVLLLPQDRFSLPR